MRQPALGTSYLKTSGGSSDAAVDGSVTPVEFYWEAQFRVAASRMVAIVEDSGGFTAGKYGAITKLSNGIDFEYTRGGQTIDLLDGQSIKTIADWAGIAYDLNDLRFGSGNDYAVVRFSFNKIGPALYLEAGDRITIRINDDLTGLIGHRFHMQGLFGQFPEDRRY